MKAKAHSKAARTAFGQSAKAPKNAAFNALSPINAVTVCKLAVEGLPDVDMKSVKIVNLRRSPKKFCLCYAGTGFDDMYEIDFEDYTVGNGDLECTLRDRTTGRRMYANRLVIGLALGMEEVCNTSGSLMGGYVWSRAGMYLESSDRNEFLHHIMMRLSALKEYLPAHVHERALTLSGMHARGDLQKIAELDFVIEDAGEIFNDVMQRAIGSSVKSYDDYQAKGFFKDNNMTLGHMLLVGQVFKVYADLHDAEQMTNIENYCRVPIRARAAEIRSSLIAPRQPVRNTPVIHP